MFFVLFVSCFCFFRAFERRNYQSQSKRLFLFCNAVGEKRDPPAAASERKKTKHLLFLAFREGCEKVQKARSYPLPQPGQSGACVVYFFETSEHRAYCPYPRWPTSRAQPPSPSTPRDAEPVVRLVTSGTLHVRMKTSVARVPGSREPILTGYDGRRDTDCEATHLLNLDR